MTPGAKASRQIRERTMRIEGLDCPDCAEKIAKGIRNLENVSEAAISFASGKLYLKYYGQLDGVGAIVASHGYKLVEDDNGSGQETRVGTRVFYAAISAAALVLGLAITNINPVLSGIFLLAAVFSGGMITFRRGISALRQRTFDINVLMTVAVTGALIIGEWWEAAMVAFLFAASNTLETYTAEKNRRSIRSLMSAAPEMAHRLRGDEVETVRVEEVMAKEEILVRPGERIPLDGFVVSGSSYAVEAAITGESMPAGKTEGDRVYAGTLNGSGSLRVSVEGTAADTTLARIVRLVEEAQLRRAPVQQFIDRFARIYTPAVIALAGVIFLGGMASGGDWRTWFYRGLALLIVACPCALVVSTPVSIAAALTNAAKRGVLIKGGVYLEQAGRIQAMVFDKTGTLTAGSPAVSHVKTLNGAAINDVVQKSASLEAHSEHLLAEAVRAYAAKLGLETLPVSAFKAHPGKGVSGSIDGVVHILGTASFLAENGVETSGSGNPDAGGDTVLYLAAAGQIKGILLVKDTLRAQSGAVLKKLRAMGIVHLAVLTGDRREVAAALMQGLEIDEIVPELLPQEKEAAIRRLRELYGSVAMVGDGINDAPALASADLGIAMGAAGNSTTLETADVTLMSDELERIPFLLELSRRTMSVIRQNIALALAIKGLAILLVFPGWLTLWLAILADMGASLLVTANGMRLLFNRE